MRVSRRRLGARRVRIGVERMQHRRRRARLLLPEHTVVPSPCVSAFGSKNPRTPRSIPKYWSNDRFSCISTITCFTSATVAMPEERYPGWIFPR